jgi:hypothetical protein
MKLRELLQTEIWSKRTTRKIWKVVGTVLVLVGLWFEVNHYWLTPSERKAARSALAKVDAIEKSDGLSKEEFGAKFSEAKQAVDATEREAWTTRDGKTSEMLSMYLDLVQVERSEQDLKIPPEFAAKYGDHSNAAAEMSRPICVITSHELHALLYE